jgi:hypothetical protein
LTSLQDLWDRRSILRATFGVLTVALLVGPWVYLNHRRHARMLAAENSVAVAAPSESPAPPQPAENPRVNETQILASCHPHLNTSPESVPNIEVSGTRYNPAGMQLKIRFWVNGNGFVTQAFNMGASVYSLQQMEDALHYVKLLTFEVPNTPECRVRQVELIGNFTEARGPSGDWITLFEMHPRYSFDGTRVVQNR